MRPTIFTGVAVTLLTLSQSPLSQAETTDCIAITSLPAVITAQGVYCFTGNLSTNVPFGNAIEIQANNVTLDLKSYKLGGLAAGLGTDANGIFAQNRQNLTIKNGTIRGFWRGIFLEDTSLGEDSSGGHVVEDLRLDGNTWFGLQIEGAGNVIQRNQVVNTGGTTVISTACGIVSRGPGARVLSNEVHNTFARTGINGNACGIDLDANSDAATIRNNRVTETRHTGTGRSDGILRIGDTNILIVDNQVSNASRTGTWGISASNSTCKDNLVDGFTTAFSSCTNGGGNFPDF